MNVLVTGATGFVGSHLCKKLINSGHDVFGITKSGNTDSINSLLKCSNFHLIKKDLTDNKSYDLPVNIDAIFHTAGILPSEKYSFNDYCKNNIMATYNLLEYARKNEIKIFVFSSTCSVYGVTEDIISEQSPINPSSEYALTKYFSECLVKMYSEIFFIRSFVFRYTIVFGEGDKNSIVHKYIKELNKNEDILLSENLSKKHRNLINVEDVALLHENVLNNVKDLPSFNLYIVGSEESIQIIDLIQYLKNSLNSDSKIAISNGGSIITSDALADISKVKNDLFLEPMTIKKGLNLIIKQLR